jgi:hypothetical protein
MLRIQRPLWPKLRMRHRQRCNQETKNAQGVAPCSQPFEHISPHIVLIWNKDPVAGRKFMPIGLGGQAKHHEGDVTSVV